jgi:hypothetical protein
MDTTTPWTGPPPEAEFLVCLAAISETLQAEVQPRAFLGELSTALHPLVPHDYLGLGYLAEDRRTFSVLGEHGGEEWIRTAGSDCSSESGRFPSVPVSPLAPVSADGDSETGRERAISIRNQRDWQFESTPLRQRVSGLTHSPASAQTACV